MQGRKNMCKKTRKTGAGQCSIGAGGGRGGFSVSQKEQQTQFSTKFAAKLSLMPPKKLIVRKET
jgi:hypothetical protein